MYFRRTIVYGREHVPADGPLIVASNHPSAFLEASVLATVIGRPIHFLVRGDMFHPRFRWLFNWTKQIPIYRQKDGISNLRKNASSFDLTYRKLAEGEAVLIFPEAKTILEKKMRPIQRGTAHLAFGTLPFLKEKNTLNILPVGVNFTEPRYPGTDVVIRFGIPFLTEQATREDRDAIDRFTETLSDSLSPLIIQIDEDGYERHYEVMASVYLRCLYRKGMKGSSHEQLARISTWVNHHDEHKKHLHQVHEYIHLLKEHNIEGAAYFPDLILMNKLRLAGMLVLKIIWLISGGWIWRLARHIIFLKIKANTFKSPVTVGVAMVLFPFVTILFLLLCLIVGWPVWWVGAWLLVLSLGIFFRAPMELIWKVLTLSGKLKSRLKKDVKGFIKQLEALEEHRA